MALCMFCVVILLGMWTKVYCMVFVQTPVSDMWAIPGELFEFDLSMDYFRSSEGWDGLTLSVVSLEPMPDWIDYIIVRKGIYTNNPPNCSYGSYDVVVRDEIAYVGEHNCGLSLYNISDKYSPTHLSQTSGYCYLQLSVVSNYVFIVSCGGSLNIYSIEQSTYDISLVSSISVSTSLGEVWSVFADDNLEYAYVSGTFGLKIYSISSLVNPQLVSTSSLAGEDGCFAVVKSNFAYIGSACIPWPNACVKFGGGVDIFDVTSKSNPQKLSTLTFDSPCSANKMDVWSLFVDETEDLMYILTGCSFHIVNISDKSNPQVLSNFDQPSPYFGISSVFIKGSYAYISRENGGLMIFDIYDPENPIFVKEFTSMASGFEKWGLDIKGNVAYTSLHNSNNIGIYICGLGGITFRGTPPESAACSTIGVTILGEDSSDSALDTFHIYVTSNDGNPCDDEPNDNEDEGYFIDREGSYVSGNSAEGAAVVLALSTPVVAVACCCCVCTCSVSTLIIIASSVTLSVLFFLNSIGFCSCCSSMFSLGGCTMICGSIVKVFKKDWKKRSNVNSVDMVESLLRDSYDIAAVKINLKLFEIKYSNLQMIRLIGKGGSSSAVFHAKWKRKDVAFKCFQTSDLFCDENDFSEFEQEVEVMSSVRHPYCLACFGCCLHPPRIGIVMEFCENGDLKMYLEENEETDIRTRILILAKISDGMEYLHERNCVHRDVKSENILLDKDLNPKITDFGVSRIYQRMGVGKTKRVGTSVYMPPEVVMSQTYTEKCDVYSFSIVIWEVLASNFEPYGGDCIGVEYKAANDEGYRPEIQKIDETIRKNYGNVIIMMQRGWQVDPEERPSFSELKDLFYSFVEGD